MNLIILSRGFSTRKSITCLVHHITNNNADDNNNNKNNDDDNNSYSYSNNDDRILHSEALCVHVSVIPFVWLINESADTRATLMQACQFTGFTHMKISLQMGSSGCDGEK